MRSHGSTAGRDVHYYIIDFLYHASFDAYILFRGDARLAADDYYRQLDARRPHRRADMAFARSRRAHKEISRPSMLHAAHTRRLFPRMRHTSLLSAAEAEAPPRTPASRRHRRPKHYATLSRYRPRAEAMQMPAAMMISSG